MVREKSTHIEVIEKVTDYAVSIGFEVAALEFSPIKGPEGNIEYLVHLKKRPEEEARIVESVDIRGLSMLLLTHLQKRIRLRRRNKKTWKSFTLSRMI